MADKLVPCKITLSLKVEKKEKIVACGNIEALGNGDVSKALNLPWYVGNYWYATIMVPVGQEVKFKLIKKKADGTDEPDAAPERTIKAEAFKGMTATCHWGGVTTCESYPLTVPMKLKIKQKLEKGSLLLAVGSIPELGNGDATKGMSITWGLMDNWGSTVQIPVGQEVTWRLVEKKKDGTLNWEGEAMRSVKAMEHDQGWTAAMKWGAAAEDKPESHKLSATELAMLYMGKQMSVLADETGKLYTESKEKYIPELIEGVKNMTTKKEDAPAEASAEDPAKAPAS